jgi:arginyl-tRNA synthetase
MISTHIYLKTQIANAIVTAFGDEFTGTDPLLGKATNPKFGDYQANAAMGLAKKLSKPPREIAKKIIGNLDVSKIAELPQIAGAGFINITLKPSYVSDCLQQIQTDSRLGIPLTATPQRVIVDFSSPNIAKEVHVGHLRSTIIGECLARVLEFQGHDVLRLNHLGDWGTQFGMLILYLQEVYPTALTTADALDLGDLVTFYKQAKQRFDEDEEFQNLARQKVVQLQAGEPETRKAWELLCAQSRREFQTIYELLDIQLTDRGESFYNPYLPDIITDLQQQGILVDSDGAKCVSIDGVTNKDGDPFHLIVQKTDGGFNYATTDLAAVKYRVTVDRAQRIIYVVDSGQSDHFEQVFHIARQVGWVDENIELVHVPFGLVQGEDGKRLKTRSGDTIKLKELLDEAVDRFEQILIARLESEGRSESPEFIQHSSELVGLSAVKYADLNLNRTSNYIFSYDKMLSDKGNTAPYLLYVYARIQSIARKGEIDLDLLPKDFHISLTEEAELTLGKHLLRLGQTISDVERDLLPNRICEYLFELSQKFNQFFEQCQVLSAAEPTRTSRLILCNLTAKTLKLGLNILGIPVLERM